MIPLQLPQPLRVWGFKVAASFEHITVLRHETVSQAVGTLSEGIVVDCTLGGGGHTEYLLENHEGIQVFGLDRDEDALAAAAKRLERFGSRFKPLHTRFSSVERALQEIGVAQVDGLLADFGVSSYQIDTAGRGFSFRFDGPLDMRMDATRDEPLSDKLETVDEATLADIIYEFGEERRSRAVARVIKASMPKTTLELADLIRSVVRKSKDGIDPATRTFQALRIWVNSELDEIRRLLESLPTVLRPGGHAALISFHSLEDRLVKRAFKTFAAPCECPKALPVCQCGKVPTFEVITRKPIVASKDEIKSNSRSRSAKLRAARRLDAA